MKVYTIVDDSENVLVTTDRLKAPEKVYALARKYDDKQTYFWCEEKELQ